MNSLRSAWEVVNPWSETQKTVRRMRGTARYLEGLDKSVQRGRMEAGQRDKLRAKNKVEFRATDAERHDFRARVEEILKFLEGNHPSLQDIQCAPERDDEEQAQGIASRVKTSIEYGDMDDYYGDGTALHAIIHRFGIRKTDNGEGEMMKSAAEKLERSCPPNTFMTEERARTRAAR